MTGIADTGFLVAFLNRRDRHHEWADEIGMRASEPLLTCDAVLAETIFQVGSVAEVLGLVQEGFLQLAFDLREISMRSSISLSAIEIAVPILQICASYE